MRLLAPLCLTLIVASNLALAQSTTGKKLYRWTDEKGEVHYTDQLPASAADASRDTLNESGRSVEHVARAMTPEEQAAYDAEQARLREAQRAAEDKANMDDVLLASYITEADLERAFKERFDLLERSIASTEASVRSQSKALTDLLNHAAGLERSGKPVPATVAQSIATTQSQAREQSQYLSKHQSEKVKLQEEFDATLARYRSATAARNAAATSNR
ncbi:MAG: DUF4124 domain-containing protein [Chiayiivirga sp.]|jgi:hypothetical protein|uniref:DUF4124 domain-containing protein n=1 Tax=Chiayiivirga sp. TaxID=2041042 RepID=UPI0025C1A38C|nr:DUF4124 domain-containing protein [Chiayiivirga sp.]MCI1711528.1 DUF4124 domain-containing protein [Chiayiivirga sp.]MCI1730551.1 DUF4124 domain-containing protein [Chiayiivirga sp.]